MTRCTVYQVHLVLYLDSERANKHLVLAELRVNVLEVGPTLSHHWLNTCCLLVNPRTRDVGPMLVYCRATVGDGGTTLNQHWFNVSCLLGSLKYHSPPPSPLTHIAVNDVTVNPSYITLPPKHVLGRFQK